jgi:secreted trypsin-like serine protease
VTARHIVTAAHCAVGADGSPIAPGGFTAVVGRADLSQATPSEVVAVERSTVHESYDAVGGANDVAVLRLARAAPQAPLALIGAAETARWAPGVRATVLGWGRTTPTGPTTAQLQQAEVPIVDDARCQAAYENDGGIDPATMLCAGDGSADTCQGDSGGPLMVPRADATFALAGITSFGMACADPAYPGVYTRVGAPALNAWLRDRLREAVVTPSAATSEPGATVSFGGWATSPDGPVEALGWDLDDDGAFTDATGPTASAAFTAPGTHRVRVTTTDATGSTIAGATTVTVPSAEVQAGTAGP